MPAVSVALATYNGAAYVGEQIESILAQTRAVDEIVVADDGSTDETIEIVRRRVPPDGPRLVVVEGRAPRSVAANFERALRATSKDIVLLSDQDDRWFPNRVARTLDALASAPELLAVHGDARLVDEHGDALGTLFAALEVSKATLADIRSGRGFGHLMRRNVATGATMALRRELLDFALPIPPGWIHDEWLAIVAASLGRLGVIDEPLLEYRQHGANAIGATRLGIVGKFRRLVEPGADRNARLVMRATSLAERLPQLRNVPHERLTDAHRKLEHERHRSALPRPRVARVVPVMRELRSGRYTDFGRGPLDALRDLLQPR